MAISKRHHYLPEFFIKGFTNDAGLIWVYDKIEDRILDKPLSPKSIFYQWNRNTLEVGGHQSDIIEQAYSYVDNRTAKYLYECRTEMDLDKVETMEHFGYIILFMIFNFWRVPQNDNQNELLMKFYSETKLDWESLLKLNALDISSIEKTKIAKTFIPIEIMREATKFNTGGKIQFKIIDFKSPVFLLSDNPVLLPKIPVDITDFSTSLIFPISRERIICFLEEPKYNLGIEFIKTADLLLMHQANRYIGFHSKEGLDNFVSGYRHFRKIGDHADIVKRDFFQSIKLSARSATNNLVQQDNG